MKILQWSVKRSPIYWDLSVLALISGRHLGFFAKPEVDWFLWFQMMPRSYGENFMTIGQAVFKLLRFSFSLVISGGHLGFWSEPLIRWCFLCLMVLWSFHENFVMIGQTVSDILRFECFGARFRPPSWILCQTGSWLFFLVWNDARKLQLKFHDDRPNGLEATAIFVFRHLFPAAILDFLPNRKWIIFPVSNDGSRLRWKFHHDRSNGR